MLLKGVIQCTDDQLKTSHNSDLVTLLLDFAMGEVLLVQEPAGVLTLRRLMSYIYMEHPFLMFLDHTQRRSTVGRTPLDE